MKKVSRILVFVMVIAISVSAFATTARTIGFADGTYQVQIALWHSEDDKESMAASAIDSVATIVVENGEAIMHITCGEMTMMGIKASLQELRIADLSGNYTDATVESTNSDGDPTGFYFTLPHTDEFITVKVNPHIALMGNKDIGARIKVDYSTLTPYTSETQGQTQVQTQVQTTAENTETVTQAVETSQMIQITETTQIITEPPETVEQVEQNEALTQAVATEIYTESSTLAYSEDNGSSVDVKIIVAIVSVFAFAGLAIGIIVYKKKKNVA